MRHCTGIRYIEKIANETDTPILIVGGLGIEPTSPLLDRLLRSGTGMSSAINGELLNITVAGPDRSLESFSRCAGRILCASLKLCPGWSYCLTQRGV